MRIVTIEHVIPSVLGKKLCFSVINNIAHIRDGKNYAGDYVSKSGSLAFHA